MIIQNANTNSGSTPVRVVSDDKPKVAVKTQEQVTTLPPTPQQLNNAVAAINMAMQKSSQNLEFTVDSNTKKVIVRMVDSQTGELIRQIPSGEMLAIARSIDQFLEFQHGLLLKQKA